MIRIVISIVALIISVAVLGNLSISINPFHVSLPYWYRPLAIFLMLMGLAVYNVGEKTKGYKDGLKDGKKITIEAIQQKVDSLNSIVK